MRKKSMTKTDASGDSSSHELEDAMGTQLSFLDFIDGPTPKQTTYLEIAACKNCSFSDVIEILFGVLIEETKCPKCGCKTLHKSDQRYINNWGYKYKTVLLGQKESI